MTVKNFTLLIWLALEGEAHSQCLFQRDLQEVFTVFPSKWKEFFFLPGKVYVWEIQLRNTTVEEFILSIDRMFIYKFVLFSDARIVHAVADEHTCIICIAYTLAEQSESAKYEYST